MPVFLNSSEFRNKYLEFELGIWKLFDYWLLIIAVFGEVENNQAAVMTIVDQRQVRQGKSFL